MQNYKKMRIRGIWEESTPYLKLVMFVILVFLFASVFTALAGVLINLIYGINILSDPNALSDISNPSVINALKMMQVLSATGTFIVPPLIAAFVYSQQPMQFLSLTKAPSWLSILAVAGIVLFSTPLINQMMVWNQQMSLPGFLKTVEEWMKGAESKAAELTVAFMKMDSVSDFLLNLLMIALLPAIGEELIFRGVIQQLFKAQIKNTFVAILFTSILFSAMHLQFYGFIPRMALGLLLGYLLEWSGSLWLPVLLHFLNNGAAVVLTYFYPEMQVDQVGINPGELWQVIISTLLTGVCIYFVFYHFYIQHKTKLSEAN
jgi:uncharacterized protein